MIHLPPDSILSRYLGDDTICITIFFRFYKYCDSILRLRFLFLTLDHGKKLNDTLNIQTVTIIIIKKNHLSSNFSRFISVFSKHKQTATKSPIEKYFLK